MYKIICSGIVNEGEIMRDLVEPFQSRILGIIYYLTIHHDSIDELSCAKFNATSKATAIKDLEYIHENYGHYFNAEYNNNILKFNNRSVGLLRKVSHKILMNSITIQLFELILVRPHLSREMYSEILSISDASFYRQVRHLNEQLSEYGHSIKSSYGQYYLHSKSENDLRNYMANFIIESQQMRDVFTKIGYEELKSILQEHLFDQPDQNDDLSLHFITYYVYVSLMRESQGFYLDIEKPYQVLSEDQFPDYKVLKKYFTGLTLNSYQNIHYDISSRYFPWDNSDEKSRVIKSINDLTQEFMETFNCNVSDERIIQIITSAYSFMRKFPNSPELFVDRPEIFTINFINENPFFASKFIALLKKYDDQFENELSLLSSYLIYALATECPESYMAMEPLRVKVFSELGHKHQDYLVDILSYTFPNLVFVEDGYDLLITTSYDTRLSDRIISINDYPSNQDLVKIREFIHTYTLQK